MCEEGHEITQWLNEWCQGENSAFEKMYKVLEPQLKTIVRHHLLQGAVGGDLTQSTAMLNQVLLHLMARIQTAQSQNAKDAPADGERGLWTNRDHFLSHIALTARSVRRDALKRHFAAKRGSGVPHVSVHQGNVADRAGMRLTYSQVALDELLVKEPHLHLAFMLRRDFGFSYETIGEVMGCGEEKVRTNVESAQKKLKDIIAVTKPETAYRYIRDLDEEQGD
jgi:DNA-directed RNA polymerase specialized sigma24 family protein